MVMRRRPVKENPGATIIMYPRRWKVAIAMVFLVFALIIILVITTTRSHIKRIGSINGHNGKYEMHMMEEGR